MRPSSQDFLVGGVRAISWAARRARAAFLVLVRSLPSSLGPSEIELDQSLESVSLPRRPKPQDVLVGFGGQRLAWISMRKRSRIRWGAGCDRPRLHSPRALLEPRLPKSESLDHRQSTYEEDLSRRSCSVRTSVMRPCSIFTQKTRMCPADLSRSTRYLPGSKEISGGTWSLCPM